MSAAAEPAAEPTEELTGRGLTRAHLVEVATRLLAEGGRDAVTTRAVAAAAGVQAPTIYRLFGDKGGLLDAVAEHGYATYLAGKQASDLDGDPVTGLRAGWDLTVEFALANPALYALMWVDPRPGPMPPAAEAGFRILRERVARLARAGRLRVPEGHAVQLIHAAGTGTVMSLLALPAEQRDLAVSRIAREACLAAITTDAPVHADGGGPGDDVGPVAAAVTLRAALPQLGSLSDAERTLLGEWLDRIAGAR